MEKIKKERKPKLVIKKFNKLTEENIEEVYKEHFEKINLSGENEIGHL